MSDDPFSLPTANLTGELISGQLPPFWPEEIAPSYNHSDINNNVGEVGSVRSDSYSTIGDTKLSLDHHEPISSPSLSRSSIKINNSPPPQRQKEKMTLRMTILIWTSLNLLSWQKMRRI